MYVFKFVEGYCIIAAMPHTEAMFMRDASLYTSIFMQVLIFAALFVFIYILIKRVDLAKNYLSKTDRSMLDIAVDCGFNSTANFNKAFKKYTSQTPSQYLQTHRMAPRDRK